MNKELLQKFLPHGVAILIFTLLTIAYFKPAFLDGKQLKQSDIVSHKGASKELVDHRKENNEEALWTNRMFGGMPAYQISTEHNSNFLTVLEKPILWLIPHPYHALFLAFICFYILMMAFGVNPWLGLLGSLAFGLSSYNLELYEAGHNSKLVAIAYMPLVLAGMVWLFRKKWLLGGTIFGVALALEVKANHVQITYYLGIVLLFVLIGYGIYQIRQKQFADLLKTKLILILGAVLAIAANASLLWTTYEYKAETIRGKSELVAKAGSNDDTEGLKRSYVTQWSYGVGESFTVLVPNFKGGESGELATDKKAVNKAPRKYRETVRSMDKYFGAQPFTSGPFYFGAITCVLFVLGLLLHNGYLKWSLLAASILGLMLSWGKNFMGLTNFFLDNVPLYNNFRAVSMTLVILEFCFPILMVLGLEEFFKQNINTEVLRKKLFWAFGLVGGLCLLFVLLPGSTNDYFKPADTLAENPQGEKEMLQEQLKQYSWPEEEAEGLMEALENARKYLFVSDAKRSLLFVALAFVLLMAFSYQKIPAQGAMAGLALLMLVDLWSVDKRYLNDKNFEKTAEVENPFPLTPANEFILKDSSYNRVLNLAVSTFNDAGTSFYHPSIGGYSAVKLRRYQELFDTCFQANFAEIGQRLNQGNLDSLNTALSKMSALNMLNMKYVIYNPSANPLQNPHALGNAWLVTKVQNVKNANEEIAAVKSFDPKTTAILNPMFKGNISKTQYDLDSSAKISLSKYAPNELLYDYVANKTQLAVFSEIFYNKGWNAYVDDQKVEIARVNYVLRALELPQGKHQIKFKFEPESYQTGSSISAASSGLLLLLLLASIIGMAKKKSDVTA